MPDAEPSEVIARLHDAGRYAELQDYCDKLLEADPADALALQNGAMARLHLGMYEEALAYCERVLEAERGDPYALRNAAYALERLRRHGEALERCGEILEGGPPRRMGAERRRPGAGRDGPLRRGFRILWARPEDGAGQPHPRS